MPIRETTGATAESIANAIRHRLVYGRRYTALVEKHGKAAVEDAMLEAGAHYAGVEEIGSSDVFYMTATALTILGENT